MNDRMHGTDREGDIERTTAVTSHEEEVQSHGQPLEAAEQEGASLEAQDLIDELAGGAPGTGASPATTRPWRSLARTPGFLRLWGAQVVSNVGDWAYLLAVATFIAARTAPDELPRVMALILAVEGGASALTGMFVAGPIADRFPRRRVLVATDVARAIAVASILVTPAPTSWHLAGVAAALGVGNAIFQPALMSSLPSLVSGERLVAANAVVTGTFHAAIMVGPVIGAALVATIGAAGAFALNAASFGVSALLLIRVPIPVTAPDEREPWSPVADLVDGARFVLGSPVARGVAVAMGLVLFFVAWQKPVELTLVREVLAPDGSDGMRAAILGAFTTAWGIGMVVGSAVAPAAARRVSRRTLLPAAVALAGACFLGAAAVPTTTVVVALWAVGGVAAGVANVSYETLLQESTPDRYLGRAFATVEAVQEGTYFLGAVAVGTFGGLLAPTASLALVGAGFCATAIVATRVLRPAREAIVLTEPALPSTAVVAVPSER